MKFIASTSLLIKYSIDFLVCLLAKLSHYVLKWLANCLNIKIDEATIIYAPVYYSVYFRILSRKTIVNPEIKAYMKTIVP